MKYQPWPTLLLAGLLACFLLTPQTSTKARSPVSVVTGFMDTLDAFDNTRWHKAHGWTNGNPFNCGWQEDNAMISNGLLTLRLDDAGCPFGCSGKAYASGEYRSNDFYHYGYFEARFKAAQSDGIVTSFFLYTGPSDGNPHDEIDIEILGKNTREMQINYYTLGVGGHEQTIPLGFDAAAGFHTYGIAWGPEAIHWIVDGVLVHTEDGSNGPLPTTPARIMMNLWPGNGVDEWLNPFTYTGPLEAEYDWIRCRAPFVTYLPQLLTGAP